MPPLVSVVMPAFNMEETIEEALVSCENQTYRHLEVIVVDDGSIDRSAAVAEQVATRMRRPVRVIRRPHVGIPGQVRNSGLRHARGSLIQFLDSDDVITVGKIARQVELISRSPLRGHVGAYCDYAFFRTLPDSTRVAERRGPEDRQHWPKHPARQFQAYTVIHRFLFPAAALREVGGFDPSLSHTEDLDLWLRLLAQGVRFVYRNEVDAFYREHISHSLSHPAAEARCRARVALRVRGYASGTALGPLAAKELEALEAWASQVLTEERAE